MIDIRIGIKVAEKFMKKHYEGYELVLAGCYKNSYIIIFDTGLFISVFRIVVVDIVSQKVMELRTA